MDDNYPGHRLSTWPCGWMVRGEYDREGYWITDEAGYRNTLKVAIVRITDVGFVAYRVVLWRLMLEFAKPNKI